jgi:glycosyltransferase involved in cell wall biosynthesis
MDLQSGVGDRIEKRSAGSSEVLRFLQRRTRSNDRSFAPAPFYATTHSIGVFFPGPFVTTARAKAPYISIVIAAYDDWPALERCLESLSHQDQPPEFEVIVVDDGSRSQAPNGIAGRSDLHLNFVRLQHSGISNARNQGIRLAKGEILLFTDCDCVLAPDCLKGLADQTAAYSQEDFFQIHLTGDTNTFAGRAEQLQLSTVQQERTVSTGHLKYLNTSGFAIRRTSAYFEPQLFDPHARRGEDTLLLSRLMRDGHLPRYLPDAIIQHAVQLTLPRYVLKGLPSGYLEGYAYAKMRSGGVRVSSSRRVRWKLLRGSVRSSKNSFPGFTALAAVVARQALNWVGAALYRISHLR